MFDKNDPIWHNTSDPAQALAAGIARHNRWAAGQPKKVRDLFVNMPNTPGAVSSSTSVS